MISYIKELREVIKMQLTGPEILRRMQLNQDKNNKPDIIITPFDEKCLGSNSYDLHLSTTMKYYTNTLHPGMKPAIPYKGPNKHDMKDWFIDEAAYKNFLKNPQEFDIRNPKFLLDPCNDESHQTTEIEIPETGLIISPNIGYLGSTVEYTETRNLFPYIDGKSSVGRNFILNHHTAGRGDDGFCGNWTLEIRTLYPTVVYPYMRIGQIYYETFIGERKPYDLNKSSHYNNQVGPTAAAKIQIEKTR